MMQKCIFCSKESRVVKASVFRFGVSVLTEFYSCQSCGKKWLTFEQEEAAERLALAKLEGRERVAAKIPARSRAARARPA